MRTKRTYRFCSTATMVANTENAEQSRELYDATIRMIRKRGGRVGSDPRIRKHYNCLNETHRRGNFGHLEFKLETVPRSFTIEFFQNINTENRNGGEYDFGRLEKMPFLVRMRYLWLADRIRETLDELGFQEDAAEAYEPRTPRDRIAHKRATCWHWKPFKPLKPSSYNSKSADGFTLTDGDPVFFLDRYCGRFGSGVCYYNLNNMWWVVAGDRLRNFASFEIYKERPAELKGRFFEPGQRNRQLKQKLKTAIREHRFERAAKLRDVLGIKPGTVSEEAAA